MPFLDKMVPLGLSVYNVFNEKNHDRHSQKKPYYGFVTRMLINAKLDRFAETYGTNTNTFVQLDQLMCR